MKILVFSIIRGPFTGFPSKCISVNLLYNLCQFPEITGFSKYWHLD